MNSLVEVTRFIEVRVACCKFATGNVYQTSKELNIFKWYKSQLKHRATAACFSLLNKCLSCPSVDGHERQCASQFNKSETSL